MPPDKRWDTMFIKVGSHLLITMAYLAIYMFIENKLIYHIDKFIGLKILFSAQYAPENSFLHKLLDIIAR